MQTLQKMLSGITRKGKPTPLINPSLHQPLNFQNRVVVEAYTPEGEVNRVEHVGNILVTWGLNQLVEQLVSGNNGFGGTPDGWVQRAVIGTGTDAIGYSADALTGSTGSLVLAGGSMVVSDGGDRTLQYNMTFIDTNNAYTIGSIGLFGSNSNDASMVAAAVLSTTVGKNTGDTVNVTYQIIAASA